MALVVIAVVLLIRLPFLNQAIQGDDVYYLAGAQHAQIDPLHPNHARYVFGGDEVSMRGHPHPPLNAWCLAGLLALFGDIREVPFHAAYIVFSLIAALSMWSLARRFSPHPLLATLLFWRCRRSSSTATRSRRTCRFWRSGWRRWRCSWGPWTRARRRAWRLRRGRCVLAALAAYQAVLVVPILAVYLWTRRGAGGLRWLALLAGPLVLAAWQLYERVSTGEMPAAVLAGYFHTYELQTLTKKLKNAAALTGHLAWLIFPALAVVAFWPVARGLWLVVLAAAAGAALADWNPLFWASVGAGVLLLVWCVCAASRDRDPDPVPAAWVLIFFAGALILFFAGSARYLLPMAAPVALLASRLLERRPAGSRPAAGVQLAFSLCLSVVNYQHWDGYRQFASSLSQESETRRVWINGEWGLRYYLEATADCPWSAGRPSVRATSWFRATWRCRSSSRPVAVRSCRSASAKSAVGCRCA